MKALIIFRNKSTDWIFKFFPNIDPLLLPILNKPLVDYLLDFFVLMGVREIRIVTEGSQGRLDQHLKNYKKRASQPLDISFSLINKEDTRETAFIKNKFFWHDQETYFVYGYGFIFYNQRLSEKFKTMFVSSAKQEAQEDFFWGSIKKGNLVLPRLKQKSTKQRYFSNLYNTKKISSIPLKNCKDYYHLSMRILNSFKNYFLLEENNLINTNNQQAARNKKGFFMGEQVIIKKNTIFEENFLIGNQVMIEKECVIGKNAILSDDVFVDEGTRVANSIILSKTYLGKWLNITDAIVYNGTLIHIPSGHVINFEDDYVAGSVRQRNKWKFWKRLIEVTVALSLIAVQTPVYILFLLLTTTYYSLDRRKVSCYLNKRFEKIDRWEYSLERGKWTKWFFMQFFLDKRELLFLMLQNKLSLIGNCPLEVSYENKQTIKTMNHYNPGVFWYSEMVDPFSDEEAELVMSELYFSNFKMPFKNTRTFTKIFFRRFFKWA